MFVFQSLNEPTQNPIRGNDIIGIDILNSRHAIAPKEVKFTIAIHN